MFWTTKVTNEYQDDSEYHPCLLSLNLWFLKLFSQEFMFYFVLDVVCEDGGYIHVCLHASEGVHMCVHGENQSRTLSAFLESLCLEIGWFHWTRGWTVSWGDLLVFTPIAEVSGIHNCAWWFAWVLGIWTQGLMVTEQVSLTHWAMSPVPCFEHVDCYLD